MTASGDFAQAKSFFASREVENAVVKDIRQASVVFNDNGIIEHKQGSISAGAVATGASERLQDLASIAAEHCAPGTTGGFECRLASGIKISALELVQALNVRCGPIDQAVRGFGLPSMGLDVVASIEVSEAAVLELFARAPAAGVMEQAHHKKQFDLHRALMSVMSGGTLEAVARGSGSS